MHISVLLDEVIDGLNLHDDSVVVDATLGYAGHSSEILKRIKRGCLYGIDQDGEAISHSKRQLSSIGDNFVLIKTNFINMKEQLAIHGVVEVDAILFDLGVSSPQLDTASRGFSYHQDARLDMRMNQDDETLDIFSAYEVVNNYSKEELTDIFFRYGEEKFSRQIADKIVTYRRNKPITTTLELVEIIKSAVPEKIKCQKHPAKKVFQAIRIEVNHELDILEESLQEALSLLAINGRLAVITFHSLEDRIVKNLFKKASSIDNVVKGMPLDKIPVKYLPKFKLVNNKAITPSAVELSKNNRAHSAKLFLLKE